jgi:ferredoxin-NADP reductase
MAQVVPFKHAVVIHKRYRLWMISPAQSERVCLFRDPLTGGPMSTTYDIRLIGRKDVAEGTMAFLFEKPPGFNFKAGQFIRFTLIDPPETDAEGNARTFSIASAPYEHNLTIATRMRDTAFKRVLKAAALGTSLVARGPYGSLTLDEAASKPAVFLTGGIGVTPFRSILMQAAWDHLPRNMTLFYSNRRPEDAAFLDELSGLEGKLAGFKLVGVMTDMAGSKRAWGGARGRIDLELLKNHIDDLTAPAYYVAGPPGMAGAMLEILKSTGAGDVRVEQFTGY